MSPVKILYVEDEVNLASIVKDTLISSGYNVELVSDGALVLDAAKTFEPDICVLDVMLPNIDGFALGKALSRRTPALPIIFLTAKSQTSDVVEGFKSGGNDYLKKPFSMEELMVRIDNLLRLKGAAPAPNTAKTIAIGRYEFDAAKLELRLDGATRQLSYREAELVQYFGGHLNDVVVKKELLLAVWGDDSYYNARNLDVYMGKLRSYFEGDATISILTLRGVGYRFVV